MNINNILGAVMKSGIAPSTSQRLKNVLGGGGGGLMESLGSLRGGQLSAESSRTPGGGGLGGVLGGVLNQAGQAVGGKQNLALGGLGALAGSLLGGGGKSLGGAVGGGVMALLGMVAYKALQGSGQQNEQVPLGLLEPQNESEQRELERHEELVLKAMINAAKADGEISEEEIQRILGKMQDAGADAEEQRYLTELMQKPMDNEELFSAAKGQPELAAQIYAASLLAVEVDTMAEKTYLENLASGLGLTPEVTQRMEEMVGLQPALSPKQ